MAKNKSKQNQFQLLSPEKYIRLKARNLPIEVCYVSDDWKDERGAVAEVIVVRRHAGGNYTFGVYVVDTLCLGVKHSVYRFNVPPDEYAGSDGTWTLKNDDYIVKGIEPDIEKPADLQKESRTAFKVTSWSDNRHGGLKHWRVGGV